MYHFDSFWSSRRNEVTKHVLNITYIHLSLPYQAIEVETNINNSSIYNNIDKHRSLTEMDSLKMVNHFLEYVDKEERQYSRTNYCVFYYERQEKTPSIDEITFGWYDNVIHVKLKVSWLMIRTWSYWIFHIIFTTWLIKKYKFYQYVHIPNLFFNTCV